VPDSIPILSFRTPAAFRKWLAANHLTSGPIWLRIYKKDSGTSSITYPEALDEALAFGWIDGVRRGVDGERYTIRFTPRKPRSIWSNVNVKRVGELIAAGRMMPSGLDTFANRDLKRSGIYSYEREIAAELSAADIKTIKADRAAWAFHEKQPTAYRRLVAHLVTSAKKPETRARRLQVLIANAREGKRIPSQL